MKRLLAVFFSLFLIISLVACGNEQPQTDGDIDIIETVSEENENSVETESVVSNGAETEEVSQNNGETQEEPQNGSSGDNNSLDSGFKAAMDSYEKFIDEYVAFMKKYNANPTDISLLSDYAAFMSDYAEYVEDFEKWEAEELNSAELAYYADVQLRVSKKMLEVAQ